MAVIGEGGRDEAVIPLEDGGIPVRTMGGLGGSPAGAPVSIPISISINGADLSSPAPVLAAVQTAMRPVVDELTTLVKTGT